MAGADDAGSSGSRGNSRRTDGSTRKKRVKNKRSRKNKRKHRKTKKTHRTKKNRKLHNTEPVTTTQQPIRQRDQMITTYNQVCGYLNVSDHNIRLRVWVS